MSYQSPSTLINKIRIYAEAESRPEIKLGANGGNSILIAVPPKLEHAYISEIQAQCSPEMYTLIDVNVLLLEFIESKTGELSELFEMLATSPEQIFKAPIGEDSDDLFYLIIDAIRKSYQNDKVPVLFNVGALYGTGIENIHIMEHEVVMNSAHPLFVIYPAVRKQDKLMYLGVRVASKYRCLVIEA